ncbi:MAG: protoporphyrinogen oxidase [Actinomycetota bacterium]|nr:protoporphyrinogen oxidase [Actinomycetota bacterium]
MTKRRVVVVGGGIAGLVAAYELMERGLQVTVVEAEGRFGGKIATTRTVDGLVIEAGADSFLSAKPAGLALCERLGISSRVIDTRPEDRRIFVWSRGRLRPLPDGLVLGSPARAGALLRSGLLSPAGAARMALDLAVRPRRDGAEESIGDFFTRRLGREAYDRVVEPLLAGIHAGDARQLSLPALFPRFADMERIHGGLVRAALATRRNGGGPGPAAEGHSAFVSLVGGMSELTESLVAMLSSGGARLLGGCRAEHLAPEGGGWRVGLEPAATLESDAVVLATPAFVTAGLVRTLSPPAAALLEAIPHASTATVSLAYRAGDTGRAPQGYGFVVPRVERRQLIAATWSSNKWPSRVIPGRHVVVRGYVGGIGRESVLNDTDDALVHLVRSELKILAGVDGQPVHTEVHRYPQGMPQYTIGHLDRVARIRAQLADWPGLAVTGAAYGGVGIPDCITDATATAVSIADFLGRS